MQRVLVVGCAGAGKSSFARRLAGATGLPLVHLDQHYWRSGWVEPEKEDWQAQVEALAAEPRWIMDGNYGGSLDIRFRRADAVFVLDMPRRLCLWRVVLRTCRHLGRTRADMTEGCPERFDAEFLRYVWTYGRDHRPRLQKALDGFGGALRILSRPAEVEAYFRSAGF